MAPQTQYVRARDGVSIAYQVVGDGPLDMIYVPQSFSAVEVFWEHPTVARFFERLALIGRVILFDRRGSGMSDRSAGAGALEDQIDDVRAVMDAAGSDHAAVFAIMEGGPMAMLLAATMPDRVDALILHAAFARTTWAEDYDFAWTTDERAEAMREFHDNWGDGTLAMHFAPSHAGDMRLQAWLGRLQRMGQGPGDARAWSEVNQHLDVRHVLGSIRVPTLLLHREGDLAIHPGHSRYLAEHIPGARLVMLPGGDTLPFLGDTETILGEVEEFLTGDRILRDTDRLLATVLFTDIVGSTERAATLGDDRWRQLLDEHDRIVRTCLARHDGREVKTVGDGFLATFDGPARALRAARTIVDDVATLGLDVRAGLHTGEVDVIGDDVGGLAVHLAARVMATAGGGEIVTSGTVKDLVVGSGLRFEDRGPRELRGVPGTWQLWRLAA
jgi:class 3 adenylate cyclase